MSYNEDHRHRFSLRHLFFPDSLAMFTEICIALTTLFILNNSRLQSRFLASPYQDVTPTAFAARPLKKFLETIGQYEIAGQITLFVLWALVGILVYILIFWLIKSGLGLSSYVKDGIKSIETGQLRDFLRWFNSLHEFFMNILIFCGGIFLFVYGMFVCFDFAGYQLQTSLSSAYPDFVKPLLLSLISAIIATRLVFIGLCFLLPRFRNWYVSAPNQ